MKHSILLILLISGGLLACQNKTTQLQKKKAGSISIRSHNGTPCRSRVMPVPDRNPAKRGKCCGLSRHAEAMSRMS